MFTEPPPAEVSAEADVPAEVQFREATWLGPEHSEELARRVQHRVLRAFRRRGLLAEDAAEDMLTWQGTGGFARLQLASRADTASLFDTGLAARVSVDASVRIEGDDRTGLERLVRY